MSDKGLVTAVAVGNATITVTDSETGLTASCIVRCNWEEQKPEEGGPADGSDSSSGSSSGDTSTPAGNVDLSAFASDIMGQYEFGMLQLLDADLMEQLYPGMGRGKRGTKIDLWHTDDHEQRRVRPGPGEGQ